MRRLEDDASMLILDNRSSYSRRIEFKYNIQIYTLNGT